jgi:hypothetical protein
LRVEHASLWRRGSENEKQPANEHERRFAPEQSLQSVSSALNVLTSRHPHPSGCAASPCKARFAARQRRSPQRRWRAAAMRAEPA